MSQQSGSFWGNVGNIFTDALDNVLNAAIDDKYGEGGSEQSEGVAEFANPNTVTQPVNHSQLPGGQPLQGMANTLGVSPTVLMAGGLALVGLIGLKVFKII